MPCSPGASSTTAGDPATNGALGRVFVAHTACDTVDVIDAARLEYIHTIRGCPEGSGVLCTQDADPVVFAAARGAGKVLVLDGNSRGSQRDCRWAEAKRPRLGRRPRSVTGRRRGGLPSTVTEALRYEHRRHALAGPTPLVRVRPFARSFPCQHPRARVCCWARWRHRRDRRQNRCLRGMTARARSGRGRGSCVRRL